MISSSVTNIACPMCSRPVTLGGGIGMMKHCFSSSWCPVGLKYPDFSHQLYSRCSTSVGEYCVDMSSGSSSTSVGHATSCMRAGAPRRHSKSPAGGAAGTGADAGAGGAADAWAMQAGCGTMRWRSGGGTAFTDRVCVFAWMRRCAAERKARPQTSQPWPRPGAHGGGGRAAALAAHKAWIERRAKEKKESRRCRIAPRNSGDRSFSAPGAAHFGCQGTE